MKSRQRWIAGEGDGDGDGDGSGGGGGGSAEWGTQIAGLPAELRDSPYLTKHTGLEGLVKEHINAQGLIGKKGFLPPNVEDLGDVNRFLTELGRPGTPSDYKRPEGGDNGAFGDSSELRDQIDVLLHESGLTQTQYDRLVPSWSSLVQSQRDTAKAAAIADTTQKINALKDEYGAAYTEKMTAGDRALEAVFGEAADDILNMELADGTLVGNNIGFIKGIIKMGEDHYVDDHLTDSRGVKVVHQDKGSAEAEIKTLLATKEFTDMYFEKNHPGHEEANMKMDNLYRIAGAT